MLDTYQKAAYSQLFEDGLNLDAADCLSKTVDAGATSCVGGNLGPASQRIERSGAGMPHNLLLENHTKKSRLQVESRGLDSIHTRTPKLFLTLQSSLQLTLHLLSQCFLLL